MKKFTHKDNTDVLTIVTHDGYSFHADEVAAIALAVIFDRREVKVIRTRDELEIKHYAEKERTIVVDVGCKYDGVKYFDHHHDINLLSAAGLYWKSLGLESKYPKVSELIKIIDDQDRGIKSAGPFEVPSLIKNYCRLTSNVTKNFETAVDFMIDMFYGFKYEQDSIEESRVIIDKSETILNNEVFFLKEYAPQWSYFINRKLTPNIKAVAWHDKRENCFKAQVTPMDTETFEFKGEGFKKDETMKFIHENGFFCVANNKETLLTYLELYKVP